MSHSADGAIAPSIFHFESQQVRTVVRGNDVWFVATDVCSVLQLREAHKALARLDDDQKGRNLIPTLGGVQTVSVINESGLYSLILRSRKPEARRFARWVTSEVLPSIRKTGGYQAFPLSGSFLATVDSGGALRLQPLATGSYALPPSDWPKVITEPGALTTAELLDVLEACTKALRSRRGAALLPSEGNQ